MKVIARNNKSGLLSVQTQSLDDIWTLYRIVQPGDEIAGWTERKIKVGDSTSQKASTASIKKMFLTITLEKVSYETDGRSLRLLGPIKEGNEHVSAGEYHSFSVDDKGEITIGKKNWPAYMVRLVDDAVLGGKGATIIVAFDRTNAMIGSLTNKGFSKITNLEGAVPKKGADASPGVAKESSFYSQIVEQLSTMDERIKPTTIILASSNFWKDPLFSQIDSQAKELRKKTKWIECDEVSENAINQLVATKEFQQLTLGASQTEIYNTFEEILRRLGTDGPATYGDTGVRSATQQAAVSIVLVSQHLMQTAREKGDFEDLESLLHAVEQSGGKVHIVGEEFTIIDKIDGLGGIVALLRYKI